MLKSRGLDRTNIIILRSAPEVGKKRAGEEEDREERKKTVISLSTDDSGKKKNWGRAKQHKTMWALLVRHISKVNFRVIIFFIFLNKKTFVYFEVFYSFRKRAPTE